MDNINNLFTDKSGTLFKTQINPVKDYVKQNTILVASYFNISHTEAKALIKKELQDNKDIVNPIVTFRERSVDGDLSYGSGTLTSYIDYVKNNKYIIAPSFTVYQNREQRKSLHSGFTMDNVNKRSKFKKLAFKNKIEKDMVEFKKNFTIQSSLKIFNNSLSGSYLAGGTVLYNPSAHYTLTSVTRSLAGTGNALSESMIAGSRHYRSPEVTIGHILAIVNNIDLTKFKSMINKYKIYLPTPDEVMTHVIKSNIDKYWSSVKDELIIYRLLKNMSGYERAMVTYVNDLHHLAFFNDKLIRDMVGCVINTVDTDVVVKDKRAYLKDIPDWVENLLIHINMSMLKGIKFNIDKFKDDEIDTLFISASNIIEQFLSFGDLIQVLFVTNVFPVSTAYIKEMVRETITLSDTDSTCATYQSWAKWWTGEYIINKETIAVAATIMTFVTVTLEQYLYKIGMNMNVSEEFAKVLQMKNEFFWDVFANTDVSKHYFSMVKIQEGNVLSDVTLEKKGVHLITSTIYDVVRTIANDMMIEILETIGKNESISILEYINKVADVESSIIKLVKSGSTDIYKSTKIKDAKTYKLEPNKSPYLNHMLWNDVFGNKYGNAPDPEYQAIKVSTTIRDKKDMVEFINNIKDKDIQTKYSKFLIRHNKDTVKTLQLPKAILTSKGIPEELLPIIDIDKIIKDNCTVLYMLITSIGFYIKPGTKMLDVLNRKE